MSSTADIDGSADPATVETRHLVLDDETFAALYAEHRAPLRRYIASKVRDPQVADDLVQNVFAKAYANRDRFDACRSFWPWLASIAVNECIDAHRHCTYAEDRLALLQRWTRDEPVDFTSTAVLQAVERRRIVRAMARLPMRQRTALELVALDEWSYADVAEHLGYTVATVKALLVRARRTLRELGTGALGTAVLRARQRWQRIIDRWQAGLSWPVSNPLVVALSGGANASGVVVVVVVALGLVGGATSSPSSVGSEAKSEPTFVVGSSADGVEHADGRGSRSPHARPVTAGVERVANEALAIAPTPSASDSPDTFVVSTFEMSPSYENDHTVFAVGRDSMRTPTSFAPLLVSRDGGGSWLRLRALGLGSVIRLLLPPSYPADNRIFALTAKGLQASHDGGDTFETLVLLPGTQVMQQRLTAAAAAVSPRFDAGDPSILLVVDSRLWRYRADTGAFDVVELGTAMAGHQVTGVAFAADGDDALVMGSLVPDATFAQWTRFSSRCVVVANVLVPMGTSLSCDPVRLPHVAGDLAPLRLVTARGSETVHMVFGQQSYVSLDGGTTFRAAGERWDARTESRYLSDLALVPSSAGRSAVVAQDSWRVVNGRLVEGAQLARTDDAGRNWTPLRVDVVGFSGASTVVVTPTGRILAGGNGGLACSEDGGRTWARLCPTPEPLLED